MVLCTEDILVHQISVILCTNISTPQCPADMYQPSSWAQWTMNKGTKHYVMGLGMGLASMVLGISSIVRGL
jgi:hypothetical protein